MLYLIARNAVKISLEDARIAGNIQLYINAKNVDFRDRD